MASAFAGPLGLLLGLQNVGAEEEGEGTRFFSVLPVFPPAPSRKPLLEGGAHYFPEEVTMIRLAQEGASLFLNGVTGVNLLPLKDSPCRPPINLRIQFRNVHGRPFVMQSACNNYASSPPRAPSGSPPSARASSESLRCVNAPPSTRPTYRVRSWRPIRHATFRAVRGWLELGLGWCWTWGVRVQNPAASKSEANFCISRWKPAGLTV
jgi:hypothetical protein